MKRLFMTLVATTLVATIQLPASADELRIGVSIEASALDPHYWNFEPNQQVLRSIFDQLLEEDYKGNPVPNLATSWRVVDDHTWEITLRKGVKWHDGSPFTADDIVFTFQRIKAGLPGAPGGFNGYIAGKQVVVLDDHTIQMKTDKPHPYTPRDLANIVIVSKKHGDGAKTVDYNTGKAMVGTGPYKFVEWVKGDRIVMEAVPDHWRGKPEWDRATYKPITSDPARLAALLSGDVDLINFVPSPDLKRLRDDPNISVYQEAAFRLHFLFPDTGRDLSPYVKKNDGSLFWPNPLRDWRVRKALSKAINRQAIRDRVMDGTSKPAGQLVDEGILGHNPSMGVEPFDPEGAKKLLAGAGFANQINLRIYCANNRGNNGVEIVQTVAQMWTRVGVKTDVQCMPESAFMPPAQKGAWSLILMGWTGSGEPSSANRLALHSRTEKYGNWNVMRYSNYRLDQVIEKAIIEMNRDKRDKLFQEAAKIAFDDLAWIPIHWGVNTWGSRKGIVYEARADGDTLVKSTHKAK
jgi:peptide/nickel transport system substrate-binding protein